MLGQRGGRGLVGGLAISHGGGKLSLVRGLAPADARTPREHGDSVVGSGGSRVSGYSA